MKVVPVRRLAASILSLLLVSCGSTRHVAVAPGGADELSQASSSPSGGPATAQVSP